MPKRSDIEKVMIIGSGPIIIGQACEFDYSGTQACKALRSLGYKIVLVNSNPATIMTDPDIADVTYIEPLNAARMEEIIERERPDALLPNLGGQSALNLASELAKNGILEKFGVKVIGVQIDAIERGEDRTAFKETMNRLGIDMARSRAVNTVEDAEAAAREIGFPVVVRPAYTMGGTGGGFCYNLEELRSIAPRGLQASLVHQILIEESLLGWEELELEVVRDAKGKMITVCFIENVDAVGVHTGDSFCTAPMLTIAEDLQKRMQEWSYKIVEGIGVIGGTNVQFAHNPKDGRVVVIEINPAPRGPPPWLPRPPAFRSPMSPPCSPPASPSTNCPTGGTAASTSTPPPATMSSSNSRAGRLKNSRACRTGWGRRCARSAKS